MQEWLIVPYLLAGLLCGVGLWRFFRRMPAGWLLDYGETEVTAELLAQQRLGVWPDLVVLLAADLLVFVLGWLFVGLFWQLPVILLAAQPLLLVMVADAKTRIIPDQFTLALLPCALLLWLADSLSGTAAWGPGLMNRILGGLAAGALLFACGWLGEKLMHREAMGMGDVKLLAVCGFLCGLDRLLVLLVLSFLTAAFLAVPLLIRRLRNPDQGSDMAFGPFIALATLLVLLLHGPITSLWQSYIGLLVR
jgi:prepilin signal peptidase PulO-like enzyme (type II secretory pathway)